MRVFVTLLTGKLMHMPDNLAQSYREVTRAGVSQAALLHKAAKLCRKQTPAKADMERTVCSSLRNPCRVSTTHDGQGHLDTLSLANFILSHVIRVR